MSIREGEGCVFASFSAERKMQTYVKAEDNEGSENQRGKKSKQGGIGGHGVGQVKGMTGSHLRSPVSVGAQ